MLNAFLLLTALSVSDISNTDLEKYYWDCDTSFMQGSLGGQDMNSCLQITEQFQKLMFNSDRDAFMDYWNRNKNTQWERRGYIQL